MVKEFSVMGLFVLALSHLVWPQTAMPHMVSVSAAKAKAGDVLTVTGENLDKTNVAALYLTDGKVDAKVVIIEENGRAIKFRVPTEAKSGRLALMVLTTGDKPKLIEEPVKVLVE
jgi:hypothetical protein